MNDQPQWTLGDRLRKSMKTAGKNPQQMADALGLTRPTVSDYLNDHVEPKVSTVARWADLTGVPVSWLLPRLDSNQQPSDYQIGPGGEAA